MAARTGHTVDDLVATGRKVIAARGAGQPVDPIVAQRLATILHTWNSLCDLRPCFATFMLDHDDILGARPELDSDGWADEIRDRLGLAHLDPTSGIRWLILFRYTVGEVPRHSALGKAERPLAVPSVLDGDLNPAFCPAPAGADPKHGHTVHLGGACTRPAREVIHPYLDFEPDHLFRVGELKRRVPGDLLPPRRAHVAVLRGLFGRDDYARRTDPEA